MHRLIAAASLTLGLGLTQDAQAQAYSQWNCLETMSGTPSALPWLDSLDTFPVGIGALTGFVSDSGYDDPTMKDITLTFRDPLAPVNELTINPIGGPGISVAVSYNAVVAFPPAGVVTPAHVRTDLSHPTPALTVYVTHSSYTSGVIRYLDETGAVIDVQTIPAYSAMWYGHDVDSGNFTDTNSVPGPTMPPTFAIPGTFDSSGMMGPTCLVDRADWIWSVEIEMTGADSEVGFNDICFPDLYIPSWANADAACVP
ncbi:MAG: hypothetical protein AAGA48_33085 [Myxococcota bacterium]